MTTNIVATGTRCRFCGNIHAVPEIAAERCGMCGRRIPEMLLGEARFTCLARDPQSLAFASGVTKVQSGLAEETKCPFGGLMLFVGAMVVGFTTFAAIAFRALRG